VLFLQPCGVHIGSLKCADNIVVIFNWSDIIQIAFPVLEVCPESKHIHPVVEWKQSTIPFHPAVCSTMFQLMASSEM